MKLKLKWNDVFFMFDSHPFTELFSVEYCKEQDLVYSKIRNNMCITICDRKRSYITPKQFHED